MTSQQEARAVNGQAPAVVGLAWIGMLALQLPAVLWPLFSTGIPPWWFWVSLVIQLVLLALTFVWASLRPLRIYLMALLLILVTGVAKMRVEASAFWASWLGDSWALSELGDKLLKLARALLMMVVLLGVGLRRRDLFLFRGQLDAPADPVPWLRISVQPWTQLGRNFAIIISAVTLVVLLLGSQLPAGALSRLLPLFPLVLLLAVINAFAEEFAFRAALLGPLRPAVGKNQALAITAVAFGLAHVFGSTPSGLAGFLLAGFLGYFLGKSMLETRGFFWAWFIHFLQDVIIFSFAAMLA